MRSRTSRPVRAGVGLLAAFALLTGGLAAIVALRDSGSTTDALTGPPAVRRADLPTASVFAQNEVCARVLPSRPGRFAPVTRPVPQAIPPTGFGRAAALCGADPAASGLYYTALVWRDDVSAARVSAFERRLISAGYTSQASDALYAQPNTTAVFAAPYGYTDTSLTSCADCLLQTVEVQRDTAAGTVEVRWV